MFSFGQISWGSAYSETGKAGIPDEVIDLDGGAITNCIGNAYKSCNVCEDVVSVTFVCTIPYSYKGGYTCSKGYTGSFSYMFDFGVITGEKIHKDAALQYPAPGSPVDQ